MGQDAQHAHISTTGPTMTQAEAMAAEPRVMFWGGGGPPCTRPPTHLSGAVNPGDKHRVPAGLRVSAEVGSNGLILWGKLPARGAPGGIELDHAVGVGLQRGQHLFEAA